MTFTPQIIVWSDEWNVMERDWWEGESKTKTEEMKRKKKNDQMTAIKWSSYVNVWPYEKDNEAKWVVADDDWEYGDVLDW